MEREDGKVKKELKSDSSQRKKTSELFLKRCFTGESCELIEGIELGLQLELLDEATTSSR